MSEPLRVGQKVRAGMVKEVASSFDGVNAVLVARIERVPTRELNQLRQSLQLIQANLLVTKNSLCRLAFQGMGWVGLDPVLEGTCGISPVSGDVASACKLLVSFSKGHEGFVLRGGVLRGQALKPQDVTTLAWLPGKQVLLSHLAGVLQSPLQRMAFLLQAPLQSLAMTLEALSRKKAKEEKKEN